jgi:hypothetical protein
LPEIMLTGARVEGAGVALLLSLMLVVPSPSIADDGERYAMTRLRLTTESARTKGCTLVGSVSDDSVKDLRRKILRMGGDTALLTFGIEDLSKIYAQVFRCPAAAPAAPAAPAPPPPPPPPGTPPPPPGPPPPPPPPPR